MNHRQAVLAVAVLVAAPQALAIPAFARRYGTDCTYCHRGFPKLTHEGQRFKERGFRMPTEDGFEASKWLKSVPIVGRGWYNQFLQEDADDISTGYLKVISAGNLGKRVSYWADDAFLISEGDDDITHVKPDNLWARVELMRAGRLYLKAGRIELDLPFTQTRTPHLLSYEIYGVATGFEVDNIGGYQDGAQIGGNFSEDWNWSAAVVKGRNAEDYEANSDQAGEFDANVFLRLSKRVNNHRFGGFTYIGRNTLAPSSRIVFRNKLQRYGLDADVWLGKLNLYGVYMHGRDSNPVATPQSPQGTQVAQSFDGGFLQADWHALDNLVVAARLNLINRPTDVTGRTKETYAGLFPGVRFYFLKHFRAAFEYGFQNQGRSSYGAFQADIVF
jgi:hypothetical protein